MYNSILLDVLCFNFREEINFHSGKESIIGHILAAVKTGGSAKSVRNIRFPVTTFGKKQLLNTVNILAPLFIVMKHRRNTENPLEINFKLKKC